MAIAHLKFEDGIELPSDHEEQNRLFASLVSSELNESKILKPGVYDLTSEHCDETKHTDEFVVDERGVGIYTSRDHNTKPRPVNESTTGNVRMVKDEIDRLTLCSIGSSVIIAGKHPEKVGTYIFSIIQYVDNRAFEV